MDERKGLEKALNKLENAIFTIVVFMVIWICASYIDVLAHNMTTYEYAWWNWFEFISNIRG